MQNNPFDDEPILTPTIVPPTGTGDEGGWYPYPQAPYKPQRTLKRWLFLGVHAVLFVGGLMLVSSSDSSNDARLLVMGWGVLLVIHTVITCLLDVREGYVQHRRIRRQLHQAQVLEKRARMLEKLQKPE